MTRFNLHLTRQLWQESKERDRKIAKLEEEMEKAMNEHKQTLTESVQREITKLENRVQKLQQISEHIEHHTAPQCTGCSVLIFSEYSKRKASAYISCGIQFNSHHKGYAFQLVIEYYEANYNDIGARLCLMKGDYDDQLQWPVNINVRLEIFNQADDHHHVVRYKVMKWKKNERDCIKIIDASLMKYCDLEREGDSVKYMMNDCLKFRVRITVV